MSTSTRVIAARVSTVALAMCGVSTTFGSPSRRFGHVRLVGEDVEAGRDAARDELLDERLLVDDRTARGVDQRRAVPHEREPLARDETARLRRQRHVQRDDVGGAEQLVEPDAAASRVGDDPHPEHLGAPRDLLPDPAEADEPERRAREVAPEQLGLRPVALPPPSRIQPVRGDEVAAAVARISASVRSATAASSTPGVFVTAIAARAARLDVDSVVADAVVRDEPQVGEEVELARPDLDDRLDQHVDAGQRARPAATTRAAHARQLVPRRPRERLRRGDPHGAEYLRERPRVEDVGRRRPAAPRRRHREPHVPEPAASSARRSSRRPGRRPRSRAARPRRRRSSRSGSPFTSSATPVSSATSIVRSRSSAFGGRWLRIRPRRMAEAADRRMAHRLGHARASARPRRALAGVERELHPVELGEHVVGQVERSRRRGCRTRSRAARGTARAPRSRRRSPRPGGAARRRRGPARRARSACGRRSRGTRSRGRARRVAISSTRRLPVRPRRVAVEVAADVGDLDERAAARRGTAPRAAPAARTGRRARA